MFFRGESCRNYMTAVREPKSRTAFQYDISCYFSLNSMAKPPPRAMNTGITLSDVTSCSAIT